MKLKKNLLFILLILIAGLFFYTCKIKLPITRDLNEIVESGRLKVVLDKSSMGLLANKDSIYGFQYEIVKAFADSLGIELEVTIESDVFEAIDELKNGDIDIVANFIPITTDEDISFSIPLNNSRQMLVQRIETDKANPINKIQLELAKDSIYLPINSLYKNRIQHLMDEIADTIYVIEIKNKTPEQMIAMVSEGKIKNTICSEKQIEKYKTLYPNLDFSLPIGFSQDQAWVINKKSVLFLEKLNDFLKDFIGSSAYWELYRKYY